MLLDSTVLIDLLRGYKPTIEKIKYLEEECEPLVTTTITVFEIIQGIPKNVSEKKMEEVENLFKTLNVLPFDIDSANNAGEIQRTLKNSGKIIDPEDAMIAGIAKKHNEPILTRNLKHYQRIKEIKTKGY